MSVPYPAELGNHGRGVACGLSRPSKPSVWRACAAVRRSVPRSGTRTIRGPPGPVQRDFNAEAPNRVWVADFTHVAARCGIVYVALAVDVFSRAIVGWAAATTKHTTLVLNALDMALGRHERLGHAVEPGLIHHSDAGSQYPGFRFTAHLVAAAIDASVGTVGDVRQ